jgi:sugar phosphate isomerase/epimerase
MQVVADLGVPGVHLSAGGGPFAPENLDAAGRKALLAHLHGLGLEVSALSAWGGDVDLCEADKADRNVAWGKRILDLAVDLECRIWQAHIGILPRDTADP